MPLPIFLVPVFIHIFNPYLLHGPFGMAEDRIQHQFLSWDQFIHIGLGVVIEYGPGTRPISVPLPVTEPRRDPSRGGRMLAGDEDYGEAAAMVPTRPVRASCTAKRN